MFSLQLPPEFLLTNVGLLILPSARERRKCECCKRTPVRQSVSCEVRALAAYYHSRCDNMTHQSMTPTIVHVHHESYK